MCQGLLMTATARLTDDTGMVKLCIRPGTGVVAVVTGIVGGKMVRPHPGCNAVVMTTGTGADDFNMVDPIHRPPGQVIMAGAAIVAASDVRKVFIACGYAIVTAAAGTGNGIMVEHRIPGIDVMADIASVHCLDMLIGFTDRNQTVMAIRAQSGDFIVIDKDHRHPTGIVMTGVTEITAVDV